MGIYNNRMKPLSLFLLAGVVLFPVMGMAQERTASGNLQQEASWNALKNLVEVADGKASTAQIAATAALDKANKMEACFNQNKIYAPTATGADATTGCKPLSSAPRLVDCYYRASAFGALIKCDEGEVMTYMCASGKNDDCVAPKGSIFNSAYQSLKMNYSTLTTDTRVHNVAMCCRMQ